MSKDISDLKFMQNAQKAVYANPFSKERELIDQSIVGEGCTLSGHLLVEKMIATLKEWTDRIKNKKVNETLDHKNYAAFKSTILLACFYEFHHEFDQHFYLEKENRKHLPKFKSSEDISGFLRQFTDFKDYEVSKYISIFYQMRRAFLLIQSRIIGDSIHSNSIRKQLWDCVFTQNPRIYENFLWENMNDFSILLLGPSGTGKSLAAKTIGESSFVPFDFKQKQFLFNYQESYYSVNLSEIPESLLESTLFGHKKGSFTGAVSDHLGVLRQVPNNGCLFIDEIGDANTSIQLKLLRVLQERTFSAVGETQLHRFSGRILAATNKDIPSSIAKGQMRLDFYYRLSSQKIKFPSLKERIQASENELLFLVKYIITNVLKIDDKNLVDETFRILNCKELEQYEWQGNIRELEQAVRQTIVTGTFNKENILHDRAHDPKSYHDILDQLVKNPISVEILTQSYIEKLHLKYKNLSKVGRMTGLDWRTIKKYLDA